MPKVEIDIDQILTCAVTLEAAPGDQLLVLNGIVIACIERRASKHARERSTEHATEVPAQRSRGHPEVPGSPYGREMQGKLAAKALAHMKRVDRPMTAQEIAEDMPRKRGEPVPKVGWAMALLRREGAVVTSGNSRRPLYRVATPADVTAPSPAHEE